MMMHPVSNELTATRTIANFKANQLLLFVFMENQYVGITVVAREVNTP